MDKKRICIVKLGGSAITAKDDSRPEVNRRNLARLARELSEAYAKESFSLFVVHGAGPYGHVPAKRYDLKAGLKSAAQLRGISETHQSMEALNQEVVLALVKAGLPAISFQPSAGGMLKDGKLSSFPVKVVEGMLAIGLVPVSYGDVLLDEKKGVSILSGDHLVPYLAEKLGASKVILVADVEGIFDRDPKKHRDARLIRELSRSNLKEISEIGAAKGTDVTGGMQGKLEELLHLADLGIDSEIISGFAPGALSKSLLGERGIGTIIKGDSHR